MGVFGADAALCGLVVSYIRAVTRSELPNQSQPVTLANRTARMLWLNVACNFPILTLNSLWFRPDSRGSGVFPYAVMLFLLILPTWRLIVWLRAAATETASAADRSRVTIWTRWLQVSIVLNLIAYLLNIIPADFHRFPWRLPQDIAGALLSLASFGVAGFLREWVTLKTAAETDPAYVKGDLRKLLRLAQPWVRAVQILLPLKYLAWMIGQPAALLVPGVLTLLVPLIQVGTLECGWRFALATADPVEGHA